MAGLYSTFSAGRLMVRREVRSELGLGVKSPNKLLKRAGMTRRGEGKPRWAGRSAPSVRRLQMRRLQLYRLIGGALVLLALAAMPVQILALVDPAGTKMADDADPFGVPPSRSKTAITMLVTAAVGLASVTLLKKRAS